MDRCCCCLIIAITTTWHTNVLAQVDQGIRLLPPINLQTVDERMSSVETSAHSSGSEAQEPEAEEIPPGTARFDVIETEQPESAWFYPRIWYPSETWEGGIELGMNGSEGNSRSLSVTAGANAERTIGLATFAWDLTYIKTMADSVETQHNALLNVDWDFDIADSAFSWFTKFFFEYDEFKAFDSRVALNAGSGYDFINHETAKLTGRFGAGFSREIGGTDDRVVPEATFGGNYEHQLTDRQKFALDVQYLPEWEQFSNYRIVTDAHWKILLDETTDLHLKIAAIDRYDSTPNGAKANDLTYSLLLLWNF